jgi:ferredoxin-type protein NapG
MPRDVSRRELFGILRREKKDKPPPSVARIHLRPPGAVAEDLFADTCQQCHKCIEVCPRECIFPLADLTPAILARRAPCVLCNGLLCTTVCPSGALQKLGRNEDVHMGTAVVIQKTCVTWHGQPCDACHQACPVPGALRLEWAQPVVDADKCTGCGLCEFNCPTTPASIVVVPRDP